MQQVKVHKNVNITRNNRILLLKGEIILKLLPRKAQKAISVFHYIVLAIS